jgi:hypothetical protein
MLKINKIHVALAKVIIRKKTLKMGFFEKIIKIEDQKQKLEKIKNKIEQIHISNLIFF